MKPLFSLLIFLFSACCIVFSQDNNRRIYADRLFHSEEYKTAIPVLKECLLLQPHDISIQRMLAKSFFYTGEMDSAYMVYRKMTAHSPDDYDAQVFLGNYYYVKANEFVKTAVNPEEKKGKLSRFKKFEEKEEPDTVIEYYLKASEYLEKAYTLYESDEIRKSLIDIYTVVGKKDKIALYKMGRNE